jgi:photosystem II stability/assembly factor-like uncharacterized protein
MFRSTDATGKVWQPIQLPPALNGITLNAVQYNSFLNLFAAVGTNGVILLSSDAKTWVNASSGTSADLYGLAVNPDGTFIAVGAQGTVILRSDGINWTGGSSDSLTTLRSVIYATTSVGTSGYIAVGDGGTILTSADGATWTLVASNTRNTLRGIANGFTGLANPVVIVGDNGTVLYSDDGINWQAQTIPQAAGTSLNAITFGRLFVVGDATGKIYLSVDGLTWPLPVPQVTTSAINAITIGGPYLNLYGLPDYSAVGANGLNLYAE